MAKETDEDGKKKPAAPSTATRDNSSQKSSPQKEDRDENVDEDEDLDDEDDDDDAADKKAADDDDADDDADDDDADDDDADDKAKAASDEKAAAAKPAPAPAKPAAASKTEPIKASSTKTPAPSKTAAGSASAKTPPAKTATSPAKTAPAKTVVATPLHDPPPVDRGPTAAPANPVQLRAVTPPPPAASLGKSVTVFMFILVFLAAGFWFLGTAESPFSKSNQPKWQINKTYTITLTLDPRDDDNLACASDADIGGKGCEFKSKTEKNPAAKDDATTLKPYKTTSDEPLLAAGVWSGADVQKGKRPNGRFNLKCQLKVEAKVSKPQVRWRATDQFGEQEQDWFAGTVSNCTVEK